MTLTENEKRHEKKEKPLTKVVIRRLPPTMTQEQFLNQASPLPEYSYIYHVKGDMSLGENAFARSYINFVYAQDVYTFKERFDNYVFIDSKGHEYPAVVEFSPFQKIPKKRGKTRMDPKCNTIELDSYYLDFAATLNKPVEQDEKPEYTLQLNEMSDDKKDTTTPLLEYIKNKRAQRLKIREVRREEREKKRKEFERKKEYGKYNDDKNFDITSAVKSYGSKIHTSKSPGNENPSDKVKVEQSEEKLDKSPIEKPTSQIRSKEKRYEDRRKEIKPRFPKKEYTDSRDYKRDDYSHREYRLNNYEAYRTEDPKIIPKKVKKYSEKREERKIEAQKAELRKLEQQAKEYKEVSSKTGSKFEESFAKQEMLEKKPNEKLLEDTKQNIREKKETFKAANIGDSNLVQKLVSEKEMEKEEKKDFYERNESSSLRRIRNKDRPTIPLYRPGMLSKRKHDADESPKKE